MSVYQIITDRILDKLSSGVAPWRKPWNDGGPPKNLATGRPYRGINYFLLSLAGESPYWLTYRQAQEHGGQVRKGAKGMPVVFWTEWTKRADSEEGDDAQEKIPVLRYYTVFNAAQCDGVAVPADESAKLANHATIDACEAIVKGLPDNRPSFADGLRASYSPSRDRVTMPALGRFDEPESYYATMFHELAHATGHKSRLARKSLTKTTFFGSVDYGHEELVAEMGAAFLCDKAGIGTATIDNSASYLDGWIKAIKGDPRLVVIAAAQAQKAADWILGFNPAE
jgi:antirestriction protein ArdC